MLLVFLREKDLPVWLRDMVSKEVLLLMEQGVGVVGLVL